VSLSSTVNLIYWIEVVVVAGSGSAALGVGIRKMTSPLLSASFWAGCLPPKVWKEVMFDGELC
jgi:hypothetical protein